MGAVDFADRRLAGRSGKMSAYTPPDKIEKSSALALVQALIGAQRAINSMKVEAETAAQGDEQMMLDACEQISNEGLEASLAIQAALSTAAQPPADGALNTIAAMFHSAEEIEGPDGLAMMVDMSVWNDALDAFDEISGDEMEPAQPPARFVMVPVEPTDKMVRAGYDAYGVEGCYGAMLAAAPKAEPVQPERVPLTAERVKEIAIDAGYSVLDETRAHFTNGIRHAEKYHGIKPAKEQA